MLRAATLCLAFSFPAATTGAIPDITLPDVGTLLGDAQASVDEFSRMASVAQARAQADQGALNARLVARWSEMKRNLTELDTQIAGVTEKNGQLQARIKDLTNHTKYMKESAQQWRSSNMFLSEAMRVVRKKLVTGLEFLKDTLNATSVAGAPDLEVLKHDKHHAPSLDEFMRSVERDATQAEEVSLLAVDGESRGLATAFLGSGMPSAAAAVPTLAFQLQRLEAAETVGEAELMGRFVALRELGEERLTAAQKEQQWLLALADELVALESSLRETIGHMKAKHLDMSLRLGAIRTFATSSGKATLRAARTSTLALQNATKSVEDGNSTVH